MFEQRGTFSRLRRGTVLATVAALALTAVGPSLAFAGSTSSQKNVSAIAVDGSGVTDISARARGHRHYRGGGGGGAAAAAAFAGIVGTGLAIAATQNRRDYDDEYYGRPAYYGPGPYYGGPTYYGGGYRGW